MLLAIFNTAALEDLLLASKEGMKSSDLVIKDIEFEYCMCSRLIGFPFEWN